MEEDPAGTTQQRRAREEPGLSGWARPAWDRPRERLCALDRGKGRSASVRVAWEGPGEGPAGRIKKGEPRREDPAGRTPKGGPSRGPLDDYGMLEQAFSGRRSVGSYAALVRHRCLQRPAKNRTKKDTHCIRNFLESGTIFRPIPRAAHLSVSHFCRGTFISLHID
jgi:hypothetical protein